MGAPKAARDALSPFVVAGFPTGAEVGFAVKSGIPSIELCLGTAGASTRFGTGTSRYLRVHSQLIFVKVCVAFKRSEPAPRGKMAAPLLLRHLRLGVYNFRAAKASAANR